MALMVNAATAQSMAPVYTCMIHLIHVSPWHAPHALESEYPDGAAFTQVGAACRISIVRRLSNGAIESTGADQDQDQQGPTSLGVRVVTPLAHGDSVR